MTRRPRSVQSLDGRGLQPVAVAQPLGDEVHDVGAEQLQRAAEDHGGRDAIHIVIAVNGDPLAARDRGEHAIDRDRHIGEHHRIVQVIERGIQEAARELRVAEAPLAEEPRDDRRNSQRGSEPTRRRLIARLRIPSRADRH